MTILERRLLQQNWKELWVNQKLAGEKMEKHRKVWTEWKFESENRNGKIGRKDEYNKIKRRDF